MSLSPMMQQYHQAKEAAGDALLLFRMGDFYELFYDDAKVASRLLGLTLTSRDKGANPVAMAGFPYHQLDQYLAKIIRAGARAAVCEQIEDPKQAKGIVQRDITRIVTPGTLTDDALLDPQACNYLVAVSFFPKSGEQTGIAWIDISTGQFHAATVATTRLGDELTRIGPSECLVAEGQQGLLPMELGDDVTVSTRPPWAFGQQSAIESLKRQFGAHSLEGFGFDAERDGLALAAAGAVLDYLVETQKASLAHVSRLLPVDHSTTLQIDSATWRSLEITQTIRDGRRDTALLGVIDRTVTSLGARLLGDWLRRPLTDVAEINARLDAVAELVEQSATAAALRESLGDVYDLERLISRVTTGRASPRDLSCIARTLAGLPKVKAKLTGRSSPRLNEIESRIDLCPDIRSRLEAALADDCPLTARDGGFIREGFSADLDEARQLMAGGKQWMANYQAAEVERTGIPSIKVGYNKVFGYFLEITHAHRDKVPQEYIRKQTLKNAERFITPELKEYEEKVLTAEDRALTIEQNLFLELRNLVAEAGTRLLGTAAALAELDALAGFAELARSRSYVRPTVVDEPVLDIEQGRHPVLDVTEPDGTFIPNDSRMAATSDDSEAVNSLLLITGPNMAGKSTYIRQTALLVLLAQIGSFVPARKATIGVADRLFARVGASDELSRGQSTFMVEMTETARILNTATRRSLVVLDEIGRGTSTYDGLSLAWAIVEHLHNQIGCRTMFATHYHELTQLAEQLPGVANRNVAVHEQAGKVVFLHQIVPGAANRSYGIHVAQLAGVPKEVNQRAEAVLKVLEAKEEGKETVSISEAKKPESGMQLTLFETMNHPMVDELSTLDLNAMTPLEAMQLLGEWQKRVNGEG